MESMRQMLRGSLGRSLATMPALDRLTAAWPVACGPALARKGVISRFEDGVVYVQVLDAAWTEQFDAMRAVLEHDLARIAGVKLAGIHFVTGTLRR
jgi:hypothetical protein